MLANPLLSAFQSVVQNKTVVGAASELGLTQAALTKRIQALEAELKVTLFLRSRRGMTLTHEGQALLKYCRQTAEAEGELLGQISGPTRGEVEVRIVGPTTLVSERLPLLIAPLYKKFPFLRLHLQSEDHANLIEMVKRGDADIAILPAESVPNEMTSKRLAPERYFLMATQKWKNRKLNEILRNERILDFYESDTTTIRYLKKFGLHERVEKNRIYVNENPALIHLLKEGVGIGTLEESLAHPLIKSGQLIQLNQGRHLEEPIAAVWYPRHHQMKYFTELIGALK